MGDGPRVACFVQMKEGHDAVQVPTGQWCFLTVKVASFARERHVFENVCDPGSGVGLVRAIQKPRGDGSELRHKSEVLFDQPHGSNRHRLGYSMRVWWCVWPDALKF